MSDLVSLCVLRLEVYEKEINMSQKLNKLGQRIPKKIRVETYPNRMEASNDNWNLLPSDKSEKLSPTGAEVPREALENDEEIGFFSGNPFVEVTKGIIHLYKEDALRDRSEAQILCLLGIPSAMTCHDLLSFTAPCHPEISNIRVLRDPTPNQYMALLNFRSHSAASEFRASFDGVPYSGLEPDRICRAVWVSRVEWTEAPSGGDQPPAGHTELPTCPVCLERMDESVDGVLTILCNHAFHAECLIKWGDSTCPVCRCVQSPELTETGTECAACPLNQTPQAADSLWICLVCGHVGCGRYQGGHAQMHYRETEHCYALQLGSGRVWDYKGDNFVHRLLQNKADGKLVPSESSSSQQTTQDPQDKVDAVQLEYTYLLTSQLDSQRRYFEEKLARVEATTALEFEKFKDKSAELLDREKELCEKLERLGKEKNAAEKKATQLSHKLVATQRELTEEKQLGKALRANQSQWQARVQSLEKAKEDSDTEIANLKEQLRDLMFYLDAQQLIAKSEDKEELAEGTVTIGTPEEKKGKQRRRKR